MNHEMTQKAATKGQEARAGSGERGAGNVAVGHSATPFCFRSKLNEPVVQTGPDTFRLLRLPGGRKPAKQWTPWMNYVFLPGTAKRYGAGLVDQHSLWKEYLRSHNLAPSALLRDGVHLNERGCQVMAEIVTNYLRHDPQLPDTGWKHLVRTYQVGKELRWAGGKLALEFEGNRVDVVCKEGQAASAVVRIDGQPPSALPGVLTLTRTTSHPGSGWPCILRVSNEKPWQIEQWTLTLTDVPAELKLIRFKVEGSKTGEDGEGITGERFVSKSGRVVIEPADWNFDYTQKVFKRPIPSGFQIRWQVVPNYVDEFVSPGVKDKAIETTVTLAQGFPNGKHRLEITGSPETPIAAVRVYRPPLEFPKPSNNATKTGEKAPVFTHVVVADTPYYLGGPQQARPPEGTLKAGTKVAVLRDTSSYLLVNSETGLRAYVAKRAVTKIEPTPGP
jgi:hypothetical protein